MRSRTMGRVGAGLVIFAIACAACERTPRAKERTAQPAVADSALDARLVKALPAGVSEKMARTGQRLYVAECAACHGPGGTGTQLGPALDSGEWTRIEGSPEEIARIIDEGLPAREPYNLPMPGREGAFDTEQLKSLAGYVYALRATKE